MIKRQGLISFIIVLIGLILLYTIFWSSISDVFGNFKEYRSTINEEQDLQNLIDNTPLLEEKFKNLKEKAVVIEKIISNERNIGNIISQFNAMSLSSGLVLNKISSSPVNNGIVSISTSVKGSISSLEKFVLLVENNLPFINIKSVDFSGGKIGSQLFVVKAETYVSEINTNNNFRAMELLSNLEQALEMDLSFIENTTLRNFIEYGNIPVKLPTSAEINNNNPYEL